MADYASEQTLQDLVAEAKAMNANLQKIASILGKAPAGNGGGAGAGASTAAAAAGVSSLAKSLSPANAAVSALSGALSLVTKGFGLLGSIVGDLLGRLGNVIGVMGAFTKSLFDGTATLSSMMGAFGKMAEQIPLIGPALGFMISGLTMVTKRLEETFNVYKGLANSGMTFGGSLIEMRTTIQQAGLTVDEFSTIASANAELFATMGGNIQAGGKMFLASQTEIMQGLGAEFGGLGMNAADASSFLLTYMKSQGSMNKQSLMDSKANAQGALELAQQTQFLAETTGKRREQVQQELEAAQNEANFKAYLSGLTADEAAKATAKLNYALAKGGKDAADMVKTGMMTGIVQPMTASQAQADALMNGGMTEFAKGLVDAKGTTEQINGQMSKSGATFTKSIDQAYQSVGTVSALQVAQGKESLLSAQMLATRNRAVQDGRLKSEQQMIEEDKATQAKITALKEGDAAKIAKSQNELKDAGLSLNTAFDKIVSIFAGPTLLVVNKLTTFVKENADLIEEVATTFSNWLKPWVEKFTSIKSWDDFKATMVEFFDSVKPILASAFEGIMDFIIAALRKNSFIAKMLFSETESEKAEKKKAGEAKTVSLGAAKAKSSSAPAGTETPSANNAKLARDLAYRIMTGQEDESKVPAELKDAVATAKTDTTLIKQAADYKSRVAQEAAEEKARAESQASAAKAAAAKTTPDVPAPTAPPVTTAQDSSASTANLLNTQLATLIRASLETAENTKKAASILSARGNALRG